MKKRVLSIILLLGVLMVFLYIFSCITIPKKNLEAYGMEGENANAILGEKEYTIDALVIGNSLAYTDFIPPQLWKDTGYTSYACGTDEQTLDYTYELLCRILKKQKPKIILMETETFSREVSTFAAVLSDLSHTIPFFRYHDRWKHLGSYDFVPPYQTDYCFQSDYLGYYFLDKTKPSPEEDIKNHMKSTDKVMSVAAWNRVFINRIVKLCKDSGIKLVLISMPNTKAWNMEMHNGVEAVAQEIGSEYIDLNLVNDQVGIDWLKDTCDNGEHMNYGGALKVTRYLTQYLEQTNLLEDHRGDSAYSDWKKHLETYEKRLKKMGKSSK